MFSRPVAAVAATKILVVDHGPRQVTVYSNRVSLAGGHPTAMVLPVPSANPDSPNSGIRVFDCTPCAALLTVLDDLFPKPPAPRGFGMARGGGASPLEVHRSGSYRYSVVPRLADFARLQHEAFGVDPTSDLAALLAAHYGAGFAFLVCVIDATAEFAPIAWEHDKAAGGRLFVPTRHFHGGGGGPPSARYEKHEEAWDHVIFSVGAIEASAGEAADPDATRGTAPARAPTAPGAIHLRSFLAARRALPPFFVPGLVAASAVRRVRIVGAHPNDDLWWACESQLAEPAGRPGACTFLLTGATHMEQAWWSCGTCAEGGVRLAGDGEGVCSACALRCHAGHALSFVSRSPFFCDCGAGCAGR